MERFETSLPTGAQSRFDVDRGSQVAFVTEDRQVRTWTCPYTGPSWLTAPRFRATREELSQLEQLLRARISDGTLYILRCMDDAEDGSAEWAACALSSEAPRTAVG